jgi:uroporphyrin-III C-methyltransferase
MSGVRTGAGDDGRRTPGSVEGNGVPVPGRTGVRGDRAGRGRVWLVGAGPGDPELITVRGLRLLESADVVLHDRLISPVLLDLIPAGTLRVPVGKTGHGPSTAQADISALLVRWARAGFDVVRLKGGDPFVFGRGGEEALALREAEIQFEVVPGVTAGVAGPAFAGIPVTHRSVARSVVFVTAHAAGADGVAIDWEAIARLDTVVLFMAGSEAATVADRLRSAGRDGSTGAALIVDASLPSQVVWTGDLATLIAAPPEVPWQRPCLLVVGDVVSLAAELAWFEPDATVRAAGVESTATASPPDRDSGNPGGRGPEREPDWALDPA